MKSNVLHITPHLGGGVGSSIHSFLCKQVARNGNYKHTVVSLEKSLTRSFCEGIRSKDIEVFESSAHPCIVDEFRRADIVQIEWWNHPLLFELFSQLPDLHSRILLRPHVNGHTFPAIPRPLVNMVDAVAMTGRAIPEYLAGAALTIPIQWIPSVADLSRFAIRRTHSKPGLTGGYCGTFDYCKMHPEYLVYLEKSLQYFDEFWFVGDWKSNDTFIKVVRDLPQFEEKIRLIDFTDNIKDIYKHLDCLLYLLNPCHYGTTENVLLEAMSAGVIPIVLDNPVEAAIVRHQRNGFIVDSADALVSVLEDLSADEDQQLAMARQASLDIQRQYSIGDSLEAMEKLYDQLMSAPKRKRSIAKVFGNDPKDWFEASLPEAGLPQHPYAAHIFNSPTKGSKKHFQHYYGKF